MPTYDYMCEKCGKFEAFQRITAEPLKQCPTCGAPVQRLISGNVNVIFKGSGFYSTDNRSDGYKSKASSEKPENASAPSTASSDSAKNDKAS